MVLEIKIFYNYTEKDDKIIKRLDFTNEVRFINLQNIILQNFPNLEGMVYVLQWKDTAKDMIIISNDDDLKIALKYLKDNLFEIYIRIESNYIQMKVLERELINKFENCKIDTIQLVENELAVNMTEGDDLRRVRGVAITANLWTHEKTSKSYITVKGHYITSEWQMHSVNLATCVTKVKRTAENIRTIVDKILKSFNADLPYNVFVTNNGSNVKAAFKDSNWMPCTGHNLNLVLTHSLEASHKATSALARIKCPQTILALIKTSNEIVALVQETENLKNLYPNLLQYTSTRWNSALMMLKSIKSNFEAMNATALSDSLSQNWSLQRLLEDVDEQLLADLIALLEPFDEATRCVSKANTPTIQLVVEVHHKITEHLNPVVEDSINIAYLRKNLKYLVRKYFKINPLHNVACLLDPRLKSNQSLMTPLERNFAVEELGNLLKEVQDSGNEFLVEAGTIGDIDEINAYLECSNEMNNILSFWKDKSIIWPNLSAVAQFVLSIPATETSRI